MADAPQPATTTRWSARRLGCLGIALPIIAFIVLIIVFALIPKGSHVVLTDLETIGVFIAIAAVPVAAVGGIVLCVMAFRRARREPAAGSHVVATIGILVAIVAVAVLVFLIYMGLQGLAGFR